MWPAACNSSLLNLERFYISQNALFHVNSYLSRISQRIRPPLFPFSVPLQFLLEALRKQVQESRWGLCAELSQELLQRRDPRRDAFSRPWESGSSAIPCPPTHPRIIQDHTHPPPIPLQAIQSNPHQARKATSFTIAAQMGISRKKLLFG